MDFRVLLEDKKGLNRKLKVLHINTLDVGGGAEQIAMELMNNPVVDSKILVKKKYSNNPNVIEFKHNKVDQFFTFLDKVIWKFGIRKRLKSYLSIDEQYNFTYYKLKQLKAYKEADIVHLHNIHGGFFDLTALIKICKNKNVVWTLHDMWAMTGGESHTFDNKNYQIGIGETPYKFLPPLNNPLLDRRQYNLNKKKILFDLIGSKITIVCVSKWLENAFKSAYVFNKKINLKTIYNGYDDKVFYNLRKRNWDKPRILFFNSLSPVKGSHLFIDCINKITEPFDLYLVGTKIKNFAEAKISNFIEKRNDLNLLFNEVDILVFPSKAETFGLLPLEAMASGVCVIVSNSTALPEIVNEETGLLFSPGDSSDLATKVNLALSNLNQTRSLGDFASINVQMKFNLEILFKRYNLLYKSIMSNN